MCDDAVGPDAPDRPARSMRSSMGFATSGAGRPDGAIEARGAFATLDERDQETKRRHDAQSDALASHRGQPRKVSVVRGAGWLVPTSSWRLIVIRRIGVCPGLSHVIWAVAGSE